MMTNFSRLSVAGSPVMGNLANPYGNVYFVDGNRGSDGNNGKSFDRPFATMAKAFTAIGSGDTIYLRGNVLEQVTSPAGIFDVTIIGAGNRPRHADAHTGNNGYSGATWKSPTSPTAATPLLIVQQQGWRVRNVLFSCPSDAAGVQIFRDGGAGDAERDGSHFEAVGCRFDGGQNHIEFKGGPAFVSLRDNLFRGSTGASLKNTTGAGIGTNLLFQIRDNMFMDNVSHIIVPTNQALIVDNTFGAFTTTGISLTGGTGKNIVSRNALSGTFSIAGGYVVANANDEWGGNYNSISGGVTAADPA